MAKRATKPVHQTMLALPMMPDPLIMPGPKTKKNKRALLTTPGRKIKAAKARVEKARAKGNSPIFREV
jgi:hypothetical protein